MPSLPIATRNARLDALIGLINNAELRIYSGSKPPVDDPATGSLLAVVNVAFTNNNDGTASLNDVPLQTTGLAAAGTGTAAGWARVVDGEGDTVIDFTVGTAGADIILNTLTIAENVAFEISDGTLTEPSGE